MPHHPGLFVVFAAKIPNSSLPRRRPQEAENPDQLCGEKTPPTASGIAQLKRHAAELKTRCA